MSSELAGEMIDAINRIQWALKVQSIFIAAILGIIVAIGATYFVWRLRQG